MVSVLLVEDDADVAEMLFDVLESLGHTVRHEGSADTALAAVAAGLRPDVVITDLMLPGGLSGLALARELRVRLPALPVVLSTGGRADTAELRAAALPVLCKPFRGSELDAAIRKALQGAQSA